MELQAFDNDPIFQKSSHDDGSNVSKRFQSNWNVSDSWYILSHILKYLQVGKPNKIRLDRFPQLYSFEEF